MAHRSHIEKIISVIHSIRNSEERTFSGKEPLPVSRLAGLARLNQNVFVSITEMLISQKLVEVIPRNKKRSTYHLSIEGRDWIKQLDALMDILEIPSPGMPS